MKVTYEPIKETILHDIDLCKLNNFIESNVPRGGTVGFCNGMVYAINYFPESDNLIDEALKGVVHWQSITCAVMKEFKNVLTTSQNISAAVVDQSNNPLIAQVIEFVKKEKKIK